MTLPDWRPTRVSIKKDDPGYVDFNSLRARNETVHVLLDGVEVKNCTTADSGEGWIERVKLDADGNFIAEGDEIVHEIVRGKVEFKIEKTQ